MTLAIVGDHRTALRRSPVACHAASRGRSRPGTAARGDGARGPCVECVCSQDGIRLIAPGGTGGELAAASWTSIGRGVSYQRANAGPAILIAYGGYSAQVSHTSAWATALMTAKLAAAGVGHVYAVKGPADPKYAAREIANTALRAHLAKHPGGTAPIYVIAHSSGSYVAHELLAQLHAATDVAHLSRISYANLDGGSAGLTVPLVASLSNIAFVYARDPTLPAGLSQNSGTMRSLGTTYAAYGDAFEVTVPGTGCASGAGWCLHDVVVTHRPHNPRNYDIARDYTDFVNRPVTTEYLDLLISRS